MAKSDPNLLTQAEYARSRKDRGLPGGSREAVRKAVEEKRISVFGPDKLVDRELADSQWERNTRARQSPHANAPASAGLDLGLAAVGQGSGSAGAADRPPAAAPVDTGYTEARARRERAEAEEAEMRTAKIRGTMVLREDVDRAMFEIMREVRDRLTSCARRIASEVASVSSAEACESIIDREHRITLELLVSSFREKVGATPAGKAGA